MGMLDINLGLLMDLPEKLVSTNADRALKMDTAEKDGGTAIEPRRTWS